MQAASSPDADLNNLADAMYRASADDRGTVQALAQELDKAQEEGSSAGLMNITSWRSDLSKRGDCVQAEHES